MKKTSNVIEVGFKKKVQAVRIGGINFEMKTGEKHRRKYLEVLSEMLKNLNDYEKEIEDADEKHDMDSIVSINKKTENTIKDCINLILGEGSFDKLYVAADEDIEVVTEAFADFGFQYQKLQEKSKGKAYIDGKKG